MYAKEEREGILWEFRRSGLFEGRDWSGATFGELSEMPDGRIEWRRGKKLKKPLGWRTIRQHRVELGYAA